MSEWDGKVVMSTPGGPIVEMSLGDLLARKDAEIKRLRADLATQQGCCDGAAAQDAHVRQEREEHRAEVDRQRAEIKRLREAIQSLTERLEVDPSGTDKIDDLEAEVERLRADRRERIATAALQGLLSDPNRQGTFSDAVRVSVEYADALIAELDKEERKP